MGISVHARESRQSSCTCIEGNTMSWWPYTDEEWEDLNYPNRKKVNG